jgi:hypothetical protein
MVEPSMDFLLSHSEQDWHAEGPGKSAIAKTAG